MAVWSTGAAGDQNPIYFQQTYDLREIRVKEYATRGIDISNAMPPGGQGLNRKDPKVAKLMNQQRQMTVSMGQMLGEEVLHVMRAPGSSVRWSLPGSRAHSRTVTCPGRKRTDSGRAGYPGTLRRCAIPIPIRLSLVTARGRRPRRGQRRGVHDDRATTEARIAAEAHDDGDAHERHGAVRIYPERCRVRLQHVRGGVRRTLKPGCAETAITDGLLDLIGSAP